MAFWLPMLLLALALTIPGAGAARAAAGPWLITDQSAVRLIAADSAVGTGETLSLGLQFKMQQGWKIYWRSPGAAGYPPNLDWSASENLESAEILWPLPKRFELFGLQTFGYGGDVVLPLRVEPRSAGQPLDLTATINFLTCSEICVPQEGVLSLTLPSGPGDSAGEQGEIIAQWLEAVPGPEREGLKLASLELEGTLEAPVLSAVALSGIPLEQPDLLVEGPPGFTYAKPEVVLSDDGRRAEFKVATGKSPIAEGVLDGKQLRLTLMDAGAEAPTGVETLWRARFSTPPPGLEQMIAAGGSGALPGEGTGGLGLLAILGLSLLGGLILNVMPCVLPVLSMKLLSVAKQGGRARADIRKGFLASAAGIIASFWVLAAGAAALKAGGLAVGWGIQFQQPLFLVAMALLLTLFALNLFGSFEIALPGWAGQAAERAPSRGLAGHFATGALATLLATPCSAPFLGTAVAFALSRGAFEIALIFTALGVGLSIPYLLVAALPGLAARLPKPGPWMVTLRRILGVAMAATALWLLTVLARQIDLAGALLVAALLLSFALVIALQNRGQKDGRTWPVAAMLAVLALGLSVTLPEPPREEGPLADSSGLWARFDQSRVDSLVAEGQVVLVDVTADWCITCKVNKSLVLERGAVFDLLMGDGIVALQADWTNPDPEISAYLESFGRYGIPFNAVYGPAAPQGIALPEILSENAVLEALRQARGG